MLMDKAIVCRVSPAGLADVHPRSCRLGVGGRSTLLGVDGVQGHGSHCLEDPYAASRAKDELSQRGGLGHDQEQGRAGQADRKDNHDTPAEHKLYDSGPGAPTVDDTRADDTDDILPRPHDAAPSDAFRHLLATAAPSLPRSSLPAVPSRSPIRNPCGGATVAAGLRCPGHVHADPDPRLTAVPMSIFLGHPLPPGDGGTRRQMIKARPPSTGDRACELLLHQ
jgi:hypothetical protein